MTPRSTLLLGSLLLAACASTTVVSPLCSGCTSVLPAQTHDLFDALDSNRDQRLDAYEALDALLELADGAGSIERSDLAALLAEADADRQAELREYFAQGDEDGDGRVLLDELPADMLPMLTGLDVDADGALVWEEFVRLDFDDPEVMVRGEAEVLYTELTGMLGQPAELGGDSAVLGDELDWLTALDTDGDGTITLAEVEDMIRAELDGATFEVDGTFAYMNGVIGATTPARVLELVVEHPEVATVVMVDVPGSMDDFSMVRAAAYLRRAGLDTHLPSGGEVASGGTDFFLAGVRRSAAPDTLFGIHSWAGGLVAPLDLPRDHHEHQLYINYYVDMGIPADFYWRTLEAAPAADIHWMTAEELELFGFFTDDAPVAP